MLNIPVFFLTYTVKENTQTSFTKMANLIPLVDARQPADQKLISNWASELFTTRQMSYLSSLIGKPVNQIKFNWSEFQQLPSFGDNPAGVGDNHYATVLMMYQAALTFDRFVNHLRQVDRNISAMGDINELMAYLRNQLPLPNMKTTIAPALHGIAPNPAELITTTYQINQYTVLAVLVAITQGNYLVHPENRASDAGVWAANLVAGDAPWDNDLAASLKRSGGLVSLYQMFDKVMKHWASVYNKNVADYDVDGAGIIQNMRKGPMFGQNLKCGPGMVPVFRNANGDVVPPQEAIITINGKSRLSGRVDVERSTCEQSVELGARRRRNPKMAAKKVVRKPVKRVAAKKSPSAILAKIAGMVKRRKPAAKKPLRAMAVPKAMMAAKTVRRIVRKPVKAVKPAVRRPLRAMAVPQAMLAKRRPVAKKPAVRRAAAPQLSLRARKVSPRIAAWDQLFNPTGLQSISPLDNIDSGSQVAHKARIVRPYRAMQIDPSMMAALKIKEAMLARRRKIAAKKRVAAKKTVKRVVKK